MHEPLKNAVERPLFRELFTLTASDATHDYACEYIQNKSQPKIHVTRDYRCNDKKFRTKIYIEIKMQ